MDAFGHLTPGGVRNSQKQDAAVLHAGSPAALCPTSYPGAAMPVPSLDAFGFVVSDMARTLAFYRALGLEFPEGADGEGHVETTLPGGIRLLFDTVAVIQSFSHYEPPTGGHRMGLAFLCETPEAVDAQYRELLASGVTSLKEPFDAFWGQRYAQVLDPDGNPVDLFAALQPK
jgi:uncharacterized glyoxalase superfamily protein PhnB